MDPAAVTDAEYLTLFLHLVTDAEYPFLFLHLILRPIPIFHRRIEAGATYPIPYCDT